MIIELGLLGDLLRLFDQATATMLGRVLPFGLALFYLLSLIDLTWTGMKIGMAPANDGSMHSAVWTLMRWVLRQGLLFAVLSSWPAIAPTIIASFRNAATTAGGFADSSIVNPSYFASQSLLVTSNMFAALGALDLLTHPVSVLLTVLSAILVQASFLFMAAAITLALIEVQIGMVAGALLFGFAGSRVTAGIAEGVIAYLFRVGVRLFVTYLLAGLIAQLVEQSFASLDWTAFFGALPNLLLLTLSLGVVAILMWTLPRRAAELVPSGNVLRF